MKATMKGRSGRGKIAAAVAVIAALTAGFFAFAPSAFAHHPVLTGESVCQSDGTFTVNWTIGNSETSPTHYMLIRAYSITPNVGTTTGVTADSSYEGIIGPGGYTGPGTVVSPGGSVPAITTGIPGNTSSVTLTVTGQWGYFSGNISTVNETRSYEVQLGGECIPPLGSLSISKVVTGNTAPPGATYTVNYDNGAGTSGQVTIQGGQTQTVADLPYGSYTLSEVNAPAGATISPNPAVVGPNSPQVDITVTNPYPNVGSFSVKKQVTGETGGYVAGSQFVVGYSCTNGPSGSLTLINGETKSVGNVPVGSTCTLGESSKPATSGPSYVYDSESWDPSNVITIGDTSNVSVVLTNPIVRIFGGLTVTKNVTGATDGYVDGSTFDFTLDCAGTEFDQTFSLEAGATKAVNGIPLGTQCTVAEVGGPDPVPGYEYQTPVLTPADGTVTINSTTVPVTVTVENPLVWLPAPAASIVDDCASGGGVVTLRNTGGGDVVFQIVVDGENFGPTHTVSSGGEEVVTVPLGEDQTATITVEADGEEVVAHEVITHDCQNPAATAAVQCAEGGVVVTLTNDGDSPVELVVLKDGQVVATVDVGDTPVDVTVPMTEDQTSTITVQDGDTTVFEEETTYDCVLPATIPPASVTTFEVLGSTETPLPVTGSNVFGLVTLASGLILAGASLIGMTRRRS